MQYQDMNGCLDAPFVFVDTESSAAENIYIKHIVDGVPTLFYITGFDVKTKTLRCSDVDFYVPWGRYKNVVRIALHFLSLNGYVFYKDGKKLDE